MLRFLDKLNKRKHRKPVTLRARADLANHTPVCPHPHAPAHLDLTAFMAGELAVLTDVALLHEPHEGGADLAGRRDVDDHGLETVPQHLDRLLFSLRDVRADENTNRSDEAVAGGEEG